MNNQMKKCRARSRRVLQVSAPVGFGDITYLACGYGHQTRNAPNLIVQGFLWRLHHIGMISFNLQSFSIPWMTGYRTKFQASNLGLIFLVRGPFVDIIQDPTIVAFLGRKTFLSPRKFQGTQELCVKNCGQRPNICLIMSHLPICCSLIILMESHF